MTNGSIGLVTTRSDRGWSACADRCAVVGEATAREIIPAASKRARRAIRWTCLCRSRQSAMCHIIQRSPVGTESFAIAWADGKEMAQPLAVALAGDQANPGYMAVGRLSS